MIKHVAIATALLAFGAASAEAQGRGNGRANGNKGKARGYERHVPPGHLPPAGLCRVWYNGVPPGHQPTPTSCREAERVAARDGGARVIYGDDDRYGDRDRRDSRGDGAGGGAIRTATRGVRPAATISSWDPRRPKAAIATAC